MTDIPPLDRTVSPDLVILREIFDDRDYGDLSPITDDELVETFGPQWEQLRTLFHEAAVLTAEQRQSIYSAYDEAWKSEAFRQAWSAVVVDDGPGDAARQALGAVGGYVDDADVGSALARRHEISTEHYALLVAPWVSVTNRSVHPADAAVPA